MMTPPRAFAALLALGLATATLAADQATEKATEPAAPTAKESATTPADKDKAALEARIRARLAQRALEKTTEASQPVKIAPAAAVTPAPAAESVTTLPGVEVRGVRITEIDLKIRKLDKDIAREKKKLKSSDLDKSLNDPALTKSLAIFGGKSTEQRESVAADRINLMEAERDLLENMKAARTKADVDLLEQKINELRDLRRNLDTLYR